MNFNFQLNDLDGQPVRDLQGNEVPQANVVIANLLMTSIKISLPALVAWEYAKQLKETGMLDLERSERKELWDVVNAWDVPVIVKAPILQILGQ